MPQDWIRAKVINRQALTENIIELTIETYHELQVVPWQWALFLFEDEQWPFQRAYSMVDQDTDNEKTMLVFIIKLLEGWRWSTILRKTTIGSEVIIKWVYGRFVLQDTQLPKVFIWTGVGIAPVINMSKYCETKKQLFFSVSYKKDLFYEDRIKKIHNLDYQIHLSKEAIPWYIEWRIDLGKQKFDPTSEFYVCWRPEIIDDIVQKLTFLGFKKIYVEKF